jgi:hypothetical protein
VLARVLKQKYNYENGGEWMPSEVLKKLINEDLVL